MVDKSRLVAKRQPLLNQEKNFHADYKEKLVPARTAREI